MFILYDPVEQKGFLKHYCFRHAVIHAARGEDLQAVVYTRDLGCDDCLDRENQLNHLQYARDDRRSKCSE